MASHFLKTETIINRPIDEVFAFFMAAENLNKITPPDLQFNILTPLPIDIQQGTLIDYKIKINGIPMNWRTEICIWEPPYRFMDQQLKGPYKIWRHEHTFESIDENTTKMTDTVEFLSPGWILEPIINAIFVERKVKYIFEYRQKAITKIFT